MADKGFGVEEVNLIGASGTPTIESPNNLNLDANTVAISTNATIGGWFTSELRTADGYNVGVGTTVPSDAAHISNTTILNAGIVTANYIYGDGSNLTNVIGVGTGLDIQSSDVEVGTATTINFGTGLTVNLAGTKGIATVTSSSSSSQSSDDGIFSFGGVYASHSETSNGAYSLVGIGSTYIQLSPVFGIYAQTSDEFGSAIACSADGNTLIVGAPMDSPPGGGSFAGLAYVYDRVGISMNLVGILTGKNDTSLAFFGYDVACSADGKTIVVGAQFGNSSDTTGSHGAAYIFDRDGNDFNEVGVLTGRYSDGTPVGDNFGRGVACSAGGDVIAIAAPKSEIPGANSSDGIVYIYDRDGNDFNEVGILTGTGGGFGVRKSLTMSADGNVVVVGASTALHPVLTTQKTGVVYIYERGYETVTQFSSLGDVGIGTTYRQVGILTGIYAEDDFEYYGGSVETNVDGSTIIVGAPGDETDGTNAKGVVYVYDRETYKTTVGVGTTFNQVGILTGSNPLNSGTTDWDYFGENVRCSADGNVIAVSAPGDEIDGAGSPTNRGVVYTFNRQGDIFTEVGVITSRFSTDDTQFGHSLACSEDLKHIYGGEKSAGILPRPYYVNVFDQTIVANDAITIREDGILITGDLNVTGDITAFYSSDERLKDNITPIEDPLAKVISISGNTFNWNDKSKKRGDDTGLIAQEVNALELPGLVVTRDNGYLAVDYHKVVPLLVEAIKELSENRNIVTSESGINYRLVVDDDGNLSTEKV